MSPGRAAALLGLAGALCAAVPVPEAGAPPVVYTVKLDDAIHPISARYLTGAIDKANEAGAALLIVELNTPGGLWTSMEEMVKAITTSKVPVVVFVGGTQAASAGFFITIAADVAIMAPGTRMGAAHPVALLGEVPKDSPMMAKIENDAAAYIRTLATNRGRNAKAAEEAVRQSSAYTEQEALKLGLIDYICKDEDAILGALDGKVVRRFAGGSVTLHLQGARLVSLDMSGRERFLSFLASPALAAFLLLAGLVLLYVEFTHPGMIAPGLVGAFCLLLFALSSQVLPVNGVGLALVVLGVVMFLLEIKVPSYGFLTLGGIACLVVGSLILFKEGSDLPEMATARRMILAIALAAGVLMAILTTLVVRAIRRRPATGASGLLGEIGTALTDLHPEGRVFLHGEYWNARAAGPVPQGARVRVTGVRGLVVDVEEVR